MKNSELIRALVALMTFGDYKVILDTPQAYGTIDRVDVQEDTEQVIIRMGAVLDDDEVDTDDKEGDNDEAA